MMPTQTAKSGRKTKKLRTSPLPAKKLPVTLLSGFLGSGKTTLLKHILQNKQGLRVALIVNDMAALNIDASLVEKSELVQTKQELVRMQNGCICCTLRLDLLKEIKRLSEAKSFDYIIIESTGIAEPMQVAETFELDPATLSMTKDETTALAAFARLDTCVTVLDLSMMKHTMSSIDTIRNAHGEGDEGDKEGDKNIGQLLIDQLEFANVIILNKTDLVLEEEIQFAEEFVRSINRKAEIIATSHSQVDIARIINTGLFSMEEARNASGWMEDLTTLSPKKTETEEYGVGSFIYSARKPFHPHRLHNWIERYFVMKDTSPSVSSSATLSSGQGGVGSKFLPYQIKVIQSIADERSKDLEQSFGWIARSKGFAWIATREMMGEWNHGGRLLELVPCLPWYVDVPQNEWEVSKEQMVKIQEDFRGIYGDKRQEIVFIGVKMNISKITQSLDECLVTDEEFSKGQVYWSKMYDSLPPWPINVGAWSQIIPVGTSFSLNIPEDCQLEITHASLDCSNESMGVSCKLYLENNTQKNLLCVLRSITSDQAHVSYRIDGSVPWKYQLHAESSLIPSGNCELHVFGYVTPLEEDEDDNEDEEGVESHEH